MSDAVEDAVPDDLGYTEDHEWARSQGGTVTVGITAFAADALGDIVYVGLPAVGAAVTKDERCGEVESTKSVSDLCSPVSGRVVRVNEAVAERPELVNQDPFGNGWLFVVQVETVAELLSAAEYRGILKGRS